MFRRNDEASSSLRSIVRDVSWRVLSLDDDDTDFRGREKTFDEGEERPMIVSR